MACSAGILLAVSAFVLSVAAPAAAQDTPEGLRGVVREAESGAPAVGAQVVATARDGATRYRTVVAGDGSWSLVGLPRGTYRMEIRALGFRPWHTEAVVGPGIASLPAVDMQRAVLALDAVVVTATRRLQKLADVPVPTELITRDQIERSGASDVAQVLLEQTGIEIQGGHPVGTGVFLQGLGDQRVLVLVDGQPVVGRISGMIDISRIPVAGVDRIEVVKGPQSTLYGSAAMGGVVNIITRSPTDHGLEAEASLIGGDQGRRDGALRLGLGGERVRAGAEVGRRMTGVVSGLSDSSDANTARWDVGLKSDFTLGTAATLGVAVGVVDEAQHWRTGPLYFRYDNLQWNARTGLKWSPSAHHFEVSAYAAGFDHVSRRSNAPDPSAGGDEETQGLVKLEGLYGLTAGRHAVDLGLSWQQDRIRSDRVFGHSRDQALFEPFAQYGLNFGAVSVLTGARLSASSDWGNAVTPQLALRWRPASTLTVRTAVGRGYRIPDFKETAITFVNIGPGFGYVVQGNPLLEPEHSGTVSLGLELAPGGTYARAHTFYTKFENFIESEALPDSGGLQVFTYQNRASGSTAGIELETGALIGQVRLEASYAWLTTRDDATSGPLLGRPEHSVRATAQWAGAFGLRLGTTAVYTGTTPMERDDSTGAITSRPGWLRVDARVSYQLWMVDLALGGENLFDSRPEGWPGFTGRRIYAGCSWRLGGLGVGTRSARR